MTQHSPLDDIRKRLDSLRRELDALARLDRLGSNAVTVTGAQNVAGVKTFTDGISFGDETLADYDTGTWTPTLTASTPGTLSTGYDIRTGRYTRVGDLVYFTFFIRTSGYNPGTASGETHITGLPVAASSSNVNVMAHVAVSNAVNWPGTPIDTAAEVVAGTSIIRLFSNQDNAARQYVGPSAIAAATDINVTGYYWV